MDGGLWDPQRTGARKRPGKANDVWTKTVYEAYRPFFLEKILEYKNMSSSIHDPTKTEDDVASAIFFDIVNRLPKEIKEKGKFFFSPVTVKRAVNAKIITTIVIDYYLLFMQKMYSPTTSVPL